MRNAVNPRESNQVSGRTVSRMVSNARARVFPSAGDFQSDQCRAQVCHRAYPQIAKSNPMLTPELLQRLEQFLLLAARHVDFVASPALPLESGRIFRRVLSHHRPSVVRTLSPTNRQPAATGNLISEFSRRVCSLSPLPGGEGQGEGERSTYCSGSNHAPRRDQSRGFENHCLCVHPASAVETSPPSR